MQSGRLRFSAGRRAVQAIRDQNQGMYWYIARRGRRCRKLKTRMLPSCVARDGIKFSPHTPFVTPRPNPHWTRAHFQPKSFDVAFVQCGHSPSHQRVPFAFVARARSVWIRPPKSLLPRLNLPLIATRNHKGSPCA